MVRTNGYTVTIKIAGTTAQRYTEFFEEEELLEFLHKMILFLHPDDEIIVTMMVSYRGFQGITEDSEFVMLHTHGRHLEQNITHL